MLEFFTITQLKQYRDFLTQHVIKYSPQPVALWHKIDNVRRKIKQLEELNKKNNMSTTLPQRKIHKTPRLLMCDAYTVGSNEFESIEAKEKSTYYITFRKTLSSIKSGPYTEGDTRYVFMGLQRILDYLFYDAITHEEIDETKRFLQTAKVSTTGLHEYTFPEELWRRVVDEFNGRPPIEVRALPEGSVCYPNEPVIEITSKVEGFGVMAAMFESKLLMVWAATEMTTQLEHWLLYNKNMIRTARPDLTEDNVDFFARLMLHDFGDRAGISPQESEWLGEAFLYTFGGTDTFAGAYQAWKNAGEIAGIATSVKALAHRNVQSYITEKDCFRAIYDAATNGDIISCVADCYDFYNAAEKELLPLALESKATGNGKVVVTRPDSGIAVEQVVWLCRLAHKHGLSEVIKIDGKEWRTGTTLRFIEGDGMTWGEMKKINEALLQEGFLPWTWGLYGQGGGKRNHIARDNSSAKYALSGVGEQNRSVVKFSETLGKTTLPGPHKLLRSTEALDAKKTIAFNNEAGEDALVVYFDGSNINKPFGPGQDDDFNVIKARIKQQIATMPLTLTTEENHNYPATDAVRAKRIELLSVYAPKRLPQNY